MVESQMKYLTRVKDDVAIVAVHLSVARVPDEVGKGQMEVGNGLVGRVVVQREGAVREPDVEARIRSTLCSGLVESKGD